MPSFTYDQAISTFSKKEKNAIEMALDEVCAFESGQIKANVQNEDGLKVELLRSLLQLFLEQLSIQTTRSAAWTAACRAFQLKGDEVPTHLVPSVLGRVKGLEAHAYSLNKAAEAIGGLSISAAKKLLLKNAGNEAPLHFESLMRSSMIGDFTVWATFDENSPDRNPFDILPSSHQALCTSLGLGMFPVTETMLLLSWKHVDVGAPPIYRPTVADAEGYPYFRPSKNMAKAWGWTEPLAPNPNNLAPWPEVVMPAISCNGLTFPYSVVLP